MSPEVRSLESVERDHILAALSALQGNVMATAKALGIDRRTLYRKLQRYGVKAQAGAPDACPLCNARATHVCAEKGKG